MAQAKSGAPMKMTKKMESTYDKFATAMNQASSVKRGGAGNGSGNGNGNAGAASNSANSANSANGIHEERVEVNQRALIDKILARYATAGAVYRELLQNSNDANSTAAEIYFTTEDHDDSSSSDAGGSTSNRKGTVTSVTYRNNGMPFRPQDWSRLKKIAEGNPDESKIGAFGVGAYSIFSICEQPIVISGTQALAFIWKGDALWTRTMNRDQVEKTSTSDDTPLDTTWTSFLMPSRDPYPLPSLKDFGGFLCSSLTFTKSLKEITVYVNNQCRLHIRKTMVESPRPVLIPKSAHTSASSASSSKSASGSTESSSLTSSSVLSSIWTLAKSTAVVTGRKSTTVMKSHPNGLFSLKADPATTVPASAQNGAHGSAAAVSHEAMAASSFLESKFHFQVTLEGQSASMLVRYIVAIVSTHIPAQLEHRMERVTKKKPPAKLQIQMVFNGQQSDVATDGGKPRKKFGARRGNKAEQIVHSVSPPIGAGRIFIGFKTSQTTGLAAHLAAPFVPTVEREAMDLQDPALRQFNLELLELSGRCMRLVLEHGMLMVGAEYVANSAKRKRWQEQYLLDLEQKRKQSATAKNHQTKNKPPNADGGSNGDGHSNSDDGDDDDDDGGDDSSIVSSTSSSSMWGFARFMAKGVTKRITKVLNTVEEIVDNATKNEATELLHPHDPFPLCMEEQEAVTLMQAFLPQPSTPDPTVGTTLAQGFVRCLPNQAPPVLTQAGGVVPGTVGKLPNYGMEVFCSSDMVVRSIVFESAQDYHSVIAQCKPVTLPAVQTHLSSIVLPRDQFVRFCKWWVAYSRLNSSTHGETQQYGYQFKESMRFRLDNEDTSPAEAVVHKLSDYLFYWDPNLIRQADSKEATKDDLPMPDAMLPKTLQDDITVRLLSDEALSSWLAEPLPIVIWIEYVSHHPSMTSGQAAYGRIRDQILSTIHQEYMRRRTPKEQRYFAEFCAKLLQEKRCLPFDANSKTAAPQPTTAIVADRPIDLYLPSAELKAFSEIDGDHFRKVAARYFAKGILSEQFCIALGVRESVSIDFLFTNLETLQWSTNPKPLVEYLRSAVYSKQDLTKLQTSSYLPCENDASRMFAPHELYIPKNKQYRHLAETGIIRLLQWPDEELTDSSVNGKFLVQELGVQDVPPLLDVLHCVSNIIKDDKAKISCLDFVAGELKQYSGTYATMYSKRLTKQQRASLKIMPCVVDNPIEQKREEGVFYSPIHCCASQQCGVMGFPILDEALLGKDRLSLFANRFEIVQDPSPTACIQQFQNLTNKAKAQLSDKPLDEALQQHLIQTFDKLFAYLSSRCSDMNASMLSPLRKRAFIPVLEKNATTSKIIWYSSEQVFFHNSSASEHSNDKHNFHEALFPMISFSPFLAAAGVRHEASAKDLLRLVLDSPQKVLRMGEDKYKLVLRRIAADPPFSRVTQEMRQTPFLLAYTMDRANEPTPGEEKKDKAGEEAPGQATQFQLAKAEDIYIVDNSFFGRMFPVKQAPHESDLEEFYTTIGSKHISKEVKKRFDVVGESPLDKTKLILTLKKCLRERSPLLVSTSITSRPLVDKAAAILDTDKNLRICEAKELKVIFSLGKSVRMKPTTCCALPVKGIGNRNKNVLYITKDFDWFDVGYAIGELILKRCQLEDAFFISSLLDAPLEQLRARGFPVDRIIQPKPAPIEKKAQAVTPIALPSMKDKPSRSSDPHEPTSESARAPLRGKGTMAQLPPEAPPGATPHQSNVASGGQDAATSKTSNSTSTSTPAPIKHNKSDKADDGEQQPMGQDEHVRVLKQMFPDADEDYLRKRLGPNPTLDDLRVIAEIMATEGYPREDQTKKHRKNDVDDSSSVKSSDSRSKVFGSKRLARAFGGLRNSTLGKAAENAGSLTSGSVGNRAKTPNATTAGGMAAPATGNAAGDPTAHSTPQRDASLQTNMERMLERTAGQSNAVNRAGIKSPDTQIAVPEGLDRGNACEVISGKNLKPFVTSNPNGRARNNIQVFSARQHQSSEAFLRNNPEVIESFAVVIGRLCEVYGIKMAAAAIFHDPTGGTIAFNSNRALHFNIRFYHALHYLQDQHQSQACYSYWYVVFAHELAHHIVSAHNKEHGFYTESYAAHFLPKLAAVFATL